MHFKCAVKHLHVIIFRIVSLHSTAYACLNANDIMCCVKRIQLIKPPNDTDNATRGNNDKTSNNLQALEALKHRHMVNREIYLLLHLQHPRIIRCMDVFWEVGSVYIAMEYASHGTLHEYLKTRNASESPLMKFVYIKSNTVFR